jgi:ribokinase
MVCSSFPILLLFILTSTVQSISRPGETVSSRDYKRRIGGKGANQAVAIARAGGAVDFYGTIGKDGEWLKAELKNHGMNIHGIIISEVGIHFP